MSINNSMKPEPKFLNKYKSCIKLSNFEATGEFKNFIDRN